MNVELNLKSAAAGIVFGSVVTGLTVVVLGRYSDAAPCASAEILVQALKECDRTEPLYVQQAGGLLNVKCNGHREDKGPK